MDIFILVIYVVFLVVTTQVLSTIERLAIRKGEGHLYPLHLLEGALVSLLVFALSLIMENRTITYCSIVGVAIITTFWLRKRKRRLKKTFVA